MARGTLQPPQEIALRLVVMGKCKVGKTALIRKFVHGEFVEAYKPTIKDLYSVQCTVGGQTHAVKIIDTGNEDTCGNELIREGDVFLLVYDVCDESSFEEIPRLYNRIQEVKVPVGGGSPDSIASTPGPFPIVVVGNKSDRVSERKVTAEEGRSVAESLNSGFGETAAKGSVEHVFLDVIQRLPDPTERRREGKYGWTCGLGALFSSLE